MADFDLLVRNARVVSASETFHADIGVRDGRIAALASGLDASAGTMIDAAGDYVTPGGVDGHCHFDQRTTDGSVMADDFETGTRSAVHGGTTTVIPFAIQFQGENVEWAANDYLARAEGKSYVDYAIHLILSDPSEAVLIQQMPRLVERGFTHFKVYMTNDDLRLNDRQMLDVLGCAKRHGALVMVHAENADCIAWLSENLLSEGHKAPRYHADARPVAVEREASHRAITLAELVDVPILIVHVSGLEPMQQIQEARRRGLRIFGETCPQYLFLTAEDLGSGEMEGAKCVCSPPPRTEADQEALWRGLDDGTFSVFSSDHAPFRYGSPEGKQPHGADTGFPWIPNGIPGVETRLSLLFDRGVLEGRITAERFVELTSLNPARLYGLYPRKGTIAIGSDADLVIWDSSTRYRLTNEGLHHNCDYTPYEGMELRARPRTVITRGRPAVVDGVLQTEPGHGAFQPSARPMEQVSARHGVRRVSGSPRA